ncbi:NUDIX domain-containing protein [Propioniferax innocua]|uniref:8-oxo-dGTP diphosphatase n=1 Tax=Propioniferax innocua TaxID=1753 RepID=A0A542ZPX6_9ACTN|nr:NUDIX domain-containing protein [Propioniferax innocua]TQL62377.1 8-oxo-dGTP diphosphatase [Propioniferax innocua]
MTRQLVAAGLVVDDLFAPTQVVVGRRISPWELAGMWEFPGGKVFEGEAPEVAVERELMEELGCAVHLGSELRNPGGGAWPINDALEMRLWWVTPLTGIDAVIPEHGPSHDEIIWADAARLGTLSWVPADHHVAQVVANHLR